MDLANRLVELRKSAGLTQTQLAERINYSDKVISKWERGESMPDIMALQALATVYGLSLDGLVNGAAVLSQFKEAQRQKTVEKKPEAPQFDEGQMKAYLKKRLKKRLLIIAIFLVTATVITFSGIGIGSAVNAHLYGEEIANTQWSLDRIEIRTYNGPEEDDVSWQKSTFESKYGITDMGTFIVNGKKEFVFDGGGVLAFRISTFIDYSEIKFKNLPELNAYAYFGSAIYYEPRLYIYATWDEIMYAFEFRKIESAGETTVEEAFEAAGNAAEMGLPLDVSVIIAANENMEMITIINFPSETLASQSKPAYDAAASAFGQTCKQNGKTLYYGTAAAMAIYEGLA